jgi:hypothetical protein
LCAGSAEWRIERAEVKTLWIYVHAFVASITWLLILLALSLTLLDANATINHDPVFTVIAVLLTLGHLSGGIYLAHSVRDEIRQAAHAGGGQDPHLHAPSRVRH